MYRAGKFSEHATNHYFNRFRALNTMVQAEYNGVSPIVKAASSQKLFMVRAVPTQRKYTVVHVAIHNYDIINTSPNILISVPVAKRQ